VAQLARNNPVPMMGRKLGRPAMIAGDYYADPVDDWMLCERCRKRPAAWFVSPATDAGVHEYCNRCMPPRWRAWAQPYTPWRNHDIEDWADTLRRGTQEDCG
jgi:hypothetical protein